MTRADCLKHSGRCFGAAIGACVTAIFYPAAWPREAWALFVGFAVALTILGLSFLRASGMETRSAADPRGRGPKGDSPTAESGDAHD